MFFRMIYDDHLAQAAYLIGCQKTGEAIVIDPERDVDRYLQAARQEDLRITAITETHIHADFLSGSRELAEKIDAKLYLSDEGGPNWKYQWLDKKQDGGSYDYQLLKDGDVFMVGNIEFKVLHTPGHTPEHISFLVTDKGGGASEPMGIATGDFVFVGDVGRPDLLETAAGQVGDREPSARRLYRSLLEFRQLPEYLQVWPAHGAGSACGKALGAVPQTTVGYEKRFNASLQSATDEDNFVNTILHGQPAPPLYFARMKKENKEGPAILGELPQPSFIPIEQLEQVAKEATILDTRQWENFTSGHLPGAIYAPAGKLFLNIAGSYVFPQEPILLVCEQEQVSELVKDLIRIGLDRVLYYTTPRVIREFAQIEGNLIATPSTHITQTQELDSDSAVILDVRNPVEYESGHFARAKNIPYTRLREHFSELPQEQKIVVHCRTGKRAAAASSFLQKQGFSVLHLSGGYEDRQAITTSTQ